MRVFCAITHFDELTKDYCLSRIDSQTRQPDRMALVSGLSPAHKSFNRALDLAMEDDADVLVHLASDVILVEDAFEILLRSYDPTKHYAVVAQGYDIFNGSEASMGLWALNLHAIRELRFRDVYKMDLDFCDRVEASSKLSRTKTGGNRTLGYHHPIWEPRELFKKFRYTAGKYRRKETAKYLAFFDKALAVNPGNKALLAGRIGLKRGLSEDLPDGSPNRQLFEAEWEDVAKLLDVRGGEFFALHEDFVSLGHELLGSSEKIAPMEGSFFNNCEIGNDSRTAKRRVSSRAALSDVSRSLKRMLKPAYDGSPPLVKDAVRLLLGKQPLTRAVRKMQSAAVDPVTEFGSANEGREDWREKWNRSPKHARVLMVAPKDFAGSMYKWAEALHVHTEFAVRLVTFQRHQYRYPVDLVVPECNDKRMHALLVLADQAGIFHLKDEHSWFMGLPQFVNLPLLNRLFFSNEFGSKPKVFTHYGGYARKFKADAEYINRVRAFDLRIAMTPDLNYDWFDGEYIPHAIDTDANPYEWSDNRVLAHSPSSQEKKGTHFLEEAVLYLQAQHPDDWAGWSLDLIHSVAFEECMRRKRKASLFFDQAGRHRVAALGINDLVGWYGNSAIEAMAFGIPTIAHLSERGFVGAERAGVFIRDNPMINVQPSRASMVDAFLSFTRSSETVRSELSMATRKYAVDFHGYAAVSQRLAEAYTDLSNKGCDKGHDSTREFSAPV